MEEKSRPIGVSILAGLAVIAAIVAIYHTLQMLGIFGVEGPLGMHEFYGFNFLGAVLYGVLALIWIWVARGLWNLDPQMWLFVVVLAVLYIILDILAILGQSSWQEMALSLLVSVIILAYAMSSGVKDAFQIDEMQAAGEAARDKQTQAEAAAAAAAAAAYEEAMTDGGDAAADAAEDAADDAADAVQQESADAVKSTLSDGEGDDGDAGDDGDGDGEAQA